MKEHFSNINLIFIILLKAFLQTMTLDLLHPIRILHPQI
jgi:hypothetical protein